MPNDTTVQSSNYTLTKLIRTGISPLSAMIGTSAYYGQLIGNPILGSINALLFSKKLGIDIWALNQMPSLKSKLLNGLLPTCTCGGNNEIEWVQQCFSNRTGLFKIYSKFEEKQMYHVFLNKFEYF
ncbi:hypothetical protein [Spiroplasma ixodetis]|uniref:hypothetical protein n=1 Tax=Spiroplasma ixodetis TaxID=2141 RepID=UPI0025757CC3|nr:hypothetical protein [Spiroplasma ixodetis]